MKTTTRVIHFVDERPNLPIRKPDEDYAASSENIFAVADGVTLAWQEPYPNPSPARTAAEVATVNLVGSLKENENKQQKELLQTAFTAANTAVKAYNDQLGINSKTVNFLEKQYAACVAAAGILINNKLHWGQINDSGLMLIDAAGNILQNQVADSAKHVRFIRHIQQQDPNRDGKAEHVYFRREVVNKHIEFEVGEVNFGVLTGEEAALDFVEYGEWEIQSGQTIIFYSDGFIPLLNEQPLRELLAKQGEEHEINTEVIRLMEGMANRQKEKTLIVVNCS